VILLSDGYLANGSEPWLIPDVASIPAIRVEHRTDPEGYQVYARNQQTLARDWVVPGTAGLEHRIGGLEKHVLTGNVSYDPQNHEAMTRMRAAKVDRVAAETPELDLIGDDRGDVLVVGWGGTYGALRQAVEALRARGKKVSHVHLRWLNPINPRLDQIIHNFKHVLVPELNTGQLRWLLRARYLVDAHGLNKIQGQPFKVGEVVGAVVALLGDRTAGMQVSPALTGEAV